MAVVSVKEKRSRKSGKGTDSKTATRTFLVETSSILDGPATAQAAAGIPQLGTTWSYDPTLIVTDIEAEDVDEHGLLFAVTVSYSTLPPEEAKDSTSQRQKVSFGFVEFTETVFKDANGKLVQNSAKMPFDPSVEKTYFDPVITIQRNEHFSPTTAINYQDRVNSDNFVIAYENGTRTTSIAAGQARMHSIQAQPASENGIDYYEVTYEIHVRQDGWILKVLDQGLMELNNGDIPQRPIRDANGDPISQPALLNGAGAKLAAVGAAPVFIDFDLYKKAAFTGLGFHLT